MSEQATSKPWYKKWWAITLFVFFGLIVIGSLADNDDSSNQQNSSDTQKQEEQTEVKNEPITEEQEVSYQYEFIESKTETTGSNTNRMDLYAFSGEIDLMNLKEFLKEKKQGFNNGTFYYVVIFDNQANAIFPQDSFTAAYGLEEEPQKHIRAFYTYNKLNGYSKLDYYEENKWESVAQTEDI